MSKDATYKKLINSMRWRRLRSAKIRSCPLCERCMERGIYTSATEVHHVRPVEKGTDEPEMERLCFMWENLMSLCHECHRDIHDRDGYHSRKAVEERKKGAVVRFVKRFFGA